MVSSSRNSLRRVAVTGIGVVSPIGCDLDSFWDSLVARRSGVGWLEDATVDGQRLPAGQAADFSGRIDDFGPMPRDAKKALRKRLKLMNRETQLGVAAAQQAMVHSGLEAAGFDPERVGVLFGAGYVSMLPEDFTDGIAACAADGAELDIDEWGAAGLPQVDPLWLLKCLPNMPACHVAIQHGLLGPNNSITQADAAANIAVAEAAAIIADGAADAMIAGGTGNQLLPYSLMHSLLEEDVARSGDDPRTISRPFDRDRRGMVLAEGAAAFVLEDYAAAVRRGAKIFGIVAGSGSSCAVNRAGVPHIEQALVNVLEAALDEAGAGVDDIGHIHAHGVSSQATDREESRAIAGVLGEAVSAIPVVAAKSHTGNAGPGSGAIELAASLLALDRGVLFPVVHCEQPDCETIPVRDASVPAGECFINLNVNSNGQASSLLVRKAA